MRKRSGVSQALLWSAAGAGLLLFARAQATKQFDFHGKVALITGGSRGLGLVLARHLAAEGARVIICARDQEELERARQDLHSRGADVFATSCDLRVREDVNRMIARILERYGQIDLLVNSAGIISVGPLEEMTLEDFTGAMNLNFWSGVFATLSVVPEMRKRKTGRIVNITSIGGKIAVPHLLPYSASKFAFFGFSRGLRSELIKDGIVVTTVVPGLMRTGSPRNANFKGKNRLEHAWFSVSDSLPFISMDADHAAQQILNACKRGEVEITLTGAARAAVVLDAWFPEFTGALLAIANRMLAGGRRNRAASSEGFGERVGHRTRRAHRNERRRSPAK